MIDTLGNHFYVFEVTFHGSDKATVDVYSELEEGQHVGITLEELAEAERIVKADERVQKLCADVGKPLSSVLFPVASETYRTDTADVDRGRHVSLTILSCRHLTSSNRL